MSIRSVSLAFAAGVFGALINSLLVWLFGYGGVTAIAGVKLAPALTAAWIYQRITWGGIWGLLFAVPVFRTSPLVRGLVFSLFPTLFQLFYVFPYLAQKGMMGLELGTLTPLFVLFFNAVWGVAAAAYYHAIEDRPSRYKR